MSEQKTETEGKGKIKIASLTIARDKTGIELKIKSNILEEFIKSAYGKEVGVAEQAEWCKGEKFYKLGSGMTHPQIESSRHTLNMDGIGSNWLMNNEDTINMSFLRIVGITEGKSFKYRGLYRESDIAAIAQSINEGLKNLFKEYNTPTCYEIEILSEK